MPRQLSGVIVVTALLLGCQPSPAKSSRAALCGDGCNRPDVLIASSVSRTRGTGQLSISEEFSRYALADVGYRAIPDVTLDDESWQGTSVTKATHPPGACGESGGIDQRIAACARTWSGAIDGNSGEATWRLVTRTTAGHEVWRDERTHLFWSDNLGSTSWCKASGNAQNSNGIDCSGALGGQSWCTDDAMQPDFKGNLLAGQGIRWRLPTLADLKLGDVDGLRYVVPNVDWFWASTTRSDGRNQAFVFNGWEGYINFSNRDGNQTVRCVGVAATTCPAGNGTVDTLLASNVSRDRTGTQGLITDELTNYALASASYRAIPDVTRDDDGLVGTSVVKVGTLPGPCGLTGNLEQRVANCATSWVGATNGNSGEGRWDLVTHTNTGKLVWLDQRTHALWSDNLGSTSWCKASGNAQNAGGIDCSGALGGQSWCTDDALFADLKGNLLAGDGVRWRLPTLNDLKLADVDGSRFVLGNPGSMWSATVRSNLRSQAFVFDGAQGFVSFPARSTSQSVRCIGFVAVSASVCAMDAGTDGGAVDAGAMDGGAMDAGAVDAGSMDAGDTDAGSTIDAGLPDGGSSRGPGAYVVSCGCGVTSIDPLAIVSLLLWRIGRRRAHSAQRTS